MSGPITVKVVTEYHKVLEALRVGLVRNTVKYVNSFGFRVIRPAYIRAYYTYFHQRTGKTKNLIKWKPITKSRPGVLRIPLYAASMDSTGDGPKVLFRNLNNKPSLREWVSKNWALRKHSSYLRQGYEWHATRGPKRGGRANMSNVKYRKRNVSRMAGYIGVSRRPWIARADRLVTSELRRSFGPNYLDIGITKAFKQAGFVRG
jgi:hypothetical protein